MKKYPHGFWADGTRKFSVDALFKLVQDRVPTEVSLRRLIRANAETETREGNFGHLIQNPTPEFKSRVHQADPTYPILLSPTGWIVDGTHRVAKLHWQGATRVWAHILSDEDLHQAVMERRSVLGFGDWKKDPLF